MLRPDGEGRVPVAVLGATGLVGERMVTLLQHHPWFDLQFVAASQQSVGTTRVGGMTVVPCTPDALDAPVVLSALPAAVAREVEPAFAADGRLVISNASAFRMDEDVPLVVPEINPDALDVVERQRQHRNWSGAIVTNPNCVVAVIALAMAPIVESFGIRRLTITTLQAVSGAGRSGIGATEILGNVIPNIAGEGEKIRRELQRVLSGLRPSGSADFPVQVTTFRVPVMHGHTASVTVDTMEPVVELDAEQLFGAPSLELPTAEPPVRVMQEPDRPQPLLDAASGSGMTTTIGQVRVEGRHTISFVACGHNLIRGAAGAAVLNAELAVSRGLTAVQAVVAPPSGRV